MSQPDLPVIEFAFPGLLRDQLVTAILAGRKTSTTALLIGYEHDGEAPPKPGERGVVVDSANRPVAVIENTAVQVLRLADVGVEHAIAEGEGHDTVAAWRAAHEDFWHSAQAREELGDPTFTVNDDTLVVAQTFRLVTTF